MIAEKLTIKSEHFARSMLPAWHGKGLNICLQSVPIYDSRAQLDPNPDPYAVNLMRSRLLILSCCNKLWTRFPIMTFLFP
jgi:hypothetical protein